ncbi:hypothetical protein [Streptomyces sp. NPDC097619]|uniref:hypothetical protein n=1 Tax=Streptomyces sp. NPDC097619 TaxID=3157228 RepID=UPI00332205AB
MTEPEPTPPRTPAPPPTAAPLPPRPRASTEDGPEFRSAAAPEPAEEPGAPPAVRPDLGPAAPPGPGRRLLDRAARPSRSRLTGAAALLAVALLSVGSLLPWVVGPDAGAVVYGYHETARGGLALGSRLGTAGGDGYVTLLIGLIALVPGALYLFGRYRTAQQPTLLAAGALATGWAVVDLVELGTVPRTDGVPLRLDAGAGLYLVTVGAVLLLLTGAVAPRSRPQDVLAASARTMALWRQGFHQEALNEQQRLVGKAAGAWHGGHPQVLLEWIRLMVMYRQLGLHANAGEALRHVLASSASLALDPDAPGTELSGRLAFASQVLRVLRTLDPATAQVVLEELLHGLSSGTRAQQNLAQEFRRLLNA